MGINEKGHPKVPFSLMFTYSAGLYDEPDCYGFHKFNGVNVNQGKNLGKYNL